MLFAIKLTVSTKEQRDQEGITHFSSHNGGTFIIDEETEEPVKISAYDYSDSMKNFDGVVGAVPICPMCYEEVFHVNGEKAKYFSHYPKTENSPECVYRVNYIPGNSHHEVTHAVNSLPLLIEFRRVLDYYFSEIAQGRIASEDQNLIQGLCKSMRDNWYEKRTIRSAFNFESTEEMYNIFTTIAPFLIKLTPKLADLGTSYLLDEPRKNSILIWRCLHLPRERPNLEFLLRVTFQFLKNHDVKLSNKPDNLKEEIIFWAFGLLSIIPWHITKKRTMA